MYKSALRLPVESFSLPSSTVSSGSRESHATVLLIKINNYLWQKTVPVAQKGHIVYKVSLESKTRTGRIYIDGLRDIQLRNKLQNELACLYVLNREGSIAQQRFLFKYYR